MNYEERLWGNYLVMHREPGIQVKRLEIKPGVRFSLQMHARRSERWIIVAGEGVAAPVGGVAGGPVNGLDRPGEEHLHRAEDTLQPGNDFGFQVEHVVSLSRGLRSIRRRPKGP